MKSMMQTTESINIPYEMEINRIAQIQVQQSDSFKLSISDQYKLFLTEYDTIVRRYQATDQIDLTKKVELVNFMFSLHMESFHLPRPFEQAFNLLKIIATKTALYHPTFFLNKHNPIAQYLSTTCNHIKLKLNHANSNECFNLLIKNIQLLIISYQSDPTIFDVQTKNLINIFKVSKAINNAAANSKKALLNSNPILPTLKTSSLKDTFTHNVSHSDDKQIKYKNSEYLFAARRLRIGEWLNLKHSNSIILVKLIWKADDNSEFIFVNKEGEKVKQSNLNELAADLKNKIIFSSKPKLTQKQQENSFLKTIG